MNIQTIRFGLILLLIIPAVVWAQNEQNNERRAKPVLSNSVYRPINKAQEAMQDGNYTAAIEIFDELLARSDRLTDYDQAKVLQMKTIAYIQQQDYVNATASSEAALDIDALELEAGKELRYNLVNMYFILERYQQALQHLEIWINTYSELEPQVCFTAAQLYLSVENLDRAQYYGELGREKHEADPDFVPQENWYRLMLSIYGRKKDYDKAAEIAEALIGFWPDKLEYYHQLSGLYQQLERHKEALSVLVVAYRNTLLKSSDDYARMLQMHRYFGYPYRGAVFYDQAINSNIVAAEEESWEDLANAWLQSRQWSLAEAALNEAAVLSDSGKHWLRLCQSTFQDERWQQSLHYCQNALDKGGLEKEESTALQLLAMINFSTNDYENAIRYFDRCATQVATHRDCNDWLEHVKNLVTIAEEEKQFAERQSRLEEERRNNRENLIDQALLMKE